MGGSWADGEPVASNSSLDATKMTTILLKFRPIAPKPVPGNGGVVATSDSSNGSPRGNPHAKVIGRGRRKSATKEINGNNKNKGNRYNGKRRKSSSSPDQTAENLCDVDDHHDDRREVTLLPLFPETPDPSPRKEDTYKMPMLLDFNRSNPVFADNYKFCHDRGW